MKSSYFVFGLSIFVQANLATELGYAEYGHPCTRQNGRQGDCMDVIYCPQAYAEEDFRRCGTSRRNICCPKPDEPGRLLESTARRESRTPDCGRRGGLNLPTSIGGSLSWPWTALLTDYRNSLCNGVLVARQWVLTAAHCLADRPNLGSTHFVRLGNTDPADRLERKAKNARIGNVYIHPDYVPHTYKHDVGLIKLLEPVNISNNIRPICLPHNNGPVKGFEPKQVAFGSSGETSNLNLEDFSVLKERKMRLLEPNSCNRKWGGLDGFKALWNLIQTGDVLCSEPMANQPKICVGDSGSGLTVSNGDVHTLLGIAVYGAGCRKDQIFFAPIEKNLEWITSTIYS